MEEVVTCKGEKCRRGNSVGFSVEDREWEEAVAGSDEGEGF